MRLSKSVALTAIAHLTFATAAYSQTSTTGNNTSTVTLAPFAVGSPTLYAAAILNINLLSFFDGTGSFNSGNNFGRVSQGGLDSSQGGLGVNGNGVNGTNSNGANGANGTNAARVTVFNRRSSLGNLYSSNLSSSTTEPVIVLTALADSSNPRAGSAGVLFRGAQNQSVQNVTFQYSPISTTTGLASSDFFSAPYLAITDGAAGASRTRYLPITSGAVVSNLSLNAYNNGSSEIFSRTSFGANNFNTNFTNGNLNNAFLTVSFNSAQLGIQGNLQRLGIVLFRKGLVLVKDVQINGSGSAGILAQSSQTFPF